MIKTAILVDGGFYRRRIVKFVDKESPEAAADTLYKYCLRHIAHDKEDCYLYRVLYYDCAPSDKQLYHPLLKKVVDLKKEPLYIWNTAFLNALRTKRKFAVRLGKLAEEQASYSLTSDATRALLNGRKAIAELTPVDFCLSIKQKGVDTRIGIDLVAMALKKQVDKIVLIAGDSDFVPAAKFVRREGVDFVLDPMGSAIKPELSEHIDGLTTFVSALGNDKPVE